MAKKPARKTLNKTAMKKTKGGIGMLLPAVQKVREAASTSQTVPTGSVTFTVDNTGGL